MKFIDDRLGRQEKAKREKSLELDKKEKVDIVLLHRRVQMG